MYYGIIVSVIVISICIMEMYSIVLSSDESGDDYLKSDRQWALYRRVLQTLRQSFCIYTFRWL